MILKKEFNKTNAANWYVIYTRNNCEKKLVESLIKAGITAESPMYTTVKQWSDRKKKCTIPLLNSIIFVQTTERALNDLYHFKHVKGILKNMGKPAIVKENEMETLRCIAREWSGENITKIDLNQNLKLGDMVIVIRGPFKGLTGELIELKNKHKVLIALKSIDVQFAIAISKSQIKTLK